MKRRKWVLQNHKPDADWTVLENMIHIDEIMELSTVEYADSTEEFEADCIPVGDIPFIAEWLWKNHKKKMEPIEIPECLRKNEFLKRGYRFVEKKDLPFGSRQKYFVKYVSELKVFNSALYDGNIPGWDVLPAGKYLVSEWINILSEFMLLVIIVVYLFQSTTTSVARIIASIWNTDLTSQTDDNIVTLLIIFFASFILCLGFIFIADRERKHFEKAQDEVKEELSN